VPPPGATATTMRSGLDGYAGSAAVAAPAQSAKAKGKRGKGNGKSGRQGFTMRIVAGPLGREGVNGEW